MKLMHRAIFTILFATMAVEFPIMTHALATPAAEVAPTKFSAPPVNGDDRYDPSVQMVRQTWHGPGYHTKVPDGTIVHGTMTSMNYALAQLAALGPGAARAGGGDHPPGADAPGHRSRQP